jgi:26S proteasome regulatory subunit T3
MQAFNRGGTAMVAESPSPTKMFLSQADAGQEEDLYREVKELERELEFVDIQEAFVKDEMKNLRRELLRAKEEVKRIQSVPLVLGQFMELIDEHHGIVLSTAGSTFYVRILSTLDKEKLKPNASMALHRYANLAFEALCQSLTARY